MTKRRGNNEGSITKRKDGTWQASVSAGYDPATGKPKRKYFYGRTRREVADMLAKALAEVKTGRFVEPTKTTLGEWLDKWLTGYKKSELKPGTYDSYETLINTHIKPALGNIPMAKLQANTLQDFYNEKLADGRVDGTGGLSTRTVRYFHAVIRQALEQAVKEGLLARNVADATNPPVIKNKQMQPLTESELLDFLETAKGDRLFAAYLLSATTGLRRGELLGLCWDCVDLERGTLSVKRQLLRLKGCLILDDSTKSKSSRRNVTLTDDTMRELKSHRKRQLQERLLLGGDYRDNGLVFCKEDGTALEPVDFNKRFQRYLTNAGLPKVRLHDLRHTHATLLLARGIPAKLVQERLGHSSITMTLDLYSHVTPEMQRLAAESMNGLLAQRKGPAKAQGESE
jgi:integrase